MSDPVQFPVLSFDGRGSKVVLERDPFANPKTFTVCLWVKPMTLCDGFRHSILGYQLRDPLRRKPGLDIYQDALLYSANLTPVPVTWEEVYAQAPAIKGPKAVFMGHDFPRFFARKEWIHIAWVALGTKCEVYRNGRLFGEGPLPYAAADAIGGYTLGFGDTYFIGEMAEVRIFDIALSAAQIAADMRRRLAGSEPGLWAYLPLDEGSGTIAHDKSGRGHHGTIVGATWTRSELPLSEPGDAELSVDFARAAPGGEVTVRWANAKNSTPSGWIGLYPNRAAADTAYTTYKYIPATASGAIVFTMPADISETYEFRLFPSGGYDRKARSAPVSVARPNGDRLTPQRSLVEPGGALDVDVFNLDKPALTGGAWVGLYADSNVPDTGYLSWQYVSAGKGSAPASTRLTFTMPEAVGDTYEFRLFPKGGYDRNDPSFSISDAVTVLPSKSLVLTVTPAEVEPGGTVIASFSGVPKLAMNSAIVLFPSLSAGTGEFIVGGDVMASPSEELPFQMPKEPGDTYQLRLFPNYSEGYEVRSGPIRVRPAAPVAKPKPQDLTEILGIGPKITELLAAEGIVNYAQLAATELMRLRAILTAGGSRFATADPSSWPEQAKLLDAGRKAELVELQKKLKPKS